MSYKLSLSVKFRRWLIFDDEPNIGPHEREQGMFARVNGIGAGLMVKQPGATCPGHPGGW